MNPEEFRALVNRIVENRDNQALVTELSTQVIENFEQLHTNHTSTNESLQGKDEEIEQLQKANMNLYLKVGNKVESDKLNNHQAGDESKLTYDDLLKDFGVGETN